MRGLAVFCIYHYRSIDLDVVTECYNNFSVFEFYDWLCDNHIVFSFKVLFDVDRSDFDYSDYYLFPVWVDDYGM